MQINIQLKSEVPLTPQDIYEIIQAISPKDCEQIAMLPVDGEVWWNEILSVHRPE